jgi:hypothetical protein
MNAAFFYEVMAAIGMKKEPIAAFWMYSTNAGSDASAPVVANAKARGVCYGDGPHYIRKSDTNPTDFLFMFDSAKTTPEEVARAITLLR